MTIKCDVNAFQNYTKLAQAGLVTFHGTGENGQLKDGHAILMYTIWYRNFEPPPNYNRYC